MWGDWQAGQKSQNATERQGCAQRSLFQDWSLHQLPRKHRWSGGPSVGHKTPFSRRLLSPEDTVPTGGSSFLTHNESAYRISSEPSAEEYPLMREMNAKTVGNVSNQLLASSIARESEEHSASSLTSDDASVTFGECGLSEFITSRPVEIVDGVNRISVYAPSADYKTLASKSPRHKPLQQVYAALKTVGPQVSPPGPKPRLLYSPSYSDVAPLLALESVKVSGGHARRPVNDPTDMFLSQPPRVTSVSVQTEPIATSVERCVEHVVGQARVTAPSLSCDVTSLSHSEDVAHKGTNSASERNLSVVECENAGAGDTLTAQESVEGTDCLGNGQAVGAKKPSSSHSAVDLKEALKEMEASLLHSEQTVDRRCPDSEVKAPRLQTFEPTDCALHDKESVNSAPNVIQTAGSKENEDVSPLLHLQLPSGRVASSTKRAASLPISIQLRKNSTEEPTESRRASRAPASVRAVTSFDSSGKAPTNSHSLKGMQQTISPDAGLNKPIELRAASWYLPTTRVLQHNEFKSLLCSCVKSSHVSTAPDSNVYAPSQNNTRNEPLAETTPTANTLLSSCAPAGVHSKGSVRLASGANEPTGGTNVSGSNDAVTAGTAMNTVECEQPGIDAAQAAAGSQTRNMEPFESEQRSSGAAPEAPSQRQQKQQVGCLSGKCFWIFLMSFRKGSGRELSEENAQDRAVDGEREQQQQVQSENQPEGGEATSHNPNASLSRTASVGRVVEVAGRGIGMKQIDKFPHDERVQVILRDMDDSPHVLRFTREPLGLPRHGKIKKVFLFSTAYYSYMLKAKALSFYARWPNNQLIVHACDRELFIGTSKSVSNQFQMDKMTFALRKGGVDENDFSAVKLEGSCASYVAQVESWMRELAAEAREGMGKVAPSEIPDVNEDARKVRGKGGELKDSDSDRSDEEGLSVWTRAHQQQQMLHSRPREGDIAGLLQKAPSRYLQVTSIVDGEFTDYSTLKSVYMNNGEDVLLADLATFVQENKGQVEKLCERYYPTFLHVARQCFFISESDAELVGQELSGATALVRSTVMELKRATEDLNVSQSVNNNVAQVRSLLQNALELAEQLETVEVRLRERKLLAAAVSLKQLLQIATPLSGFALGDYVTQNRVPKIAQEIFTCAVQELNGWFRLLRELSHSIGMAALNWKGVVEPGCVEKKLHVTEEAEWWVEVSCASASIRRAPFDEADGIAKILHGAAMQEIFEELGCGAFYRHYYTESRAQQVRLDLYDAPLKTSGVSGDVLVADMERYCATALGFMLIEDIVHHVTNPHVQSLMEILSMWEQISHAVAARVQRVADALTSSVSYSEWIVHMLRLLRRFVNITVDSVSCARLNPGVISRAVETLSDGIISTCLQEACVGANEAVLCDTFLPLYPRDMEEYEAFVSRFYLDRCKHLELPVPSGARIASGVSLPYALAVPKIGEIAIHFLERCHSIIEVNHGAAVWQSEYNNADEMLLKYLSVLFRTVTGTLQERLTSISDREIVLIAVYVTSCASMSVIISCVEQQFMLAWPIDYGGIHQRQKLGEPQLLKSSAALFEKALQGGIERLLTALIAAADIRVKPTADINYWKQLVAISSGATASPSTGTVGDSYEDRVKKGFPEAIEYLIDLIPVLMEILQISVTRSVIGTAITHAAITTQSNFEQAIYSGCGETNASGFSVLRSCVSEFERLCAVHVPRWQERIETMISGISVVQRFPLRPRQVADNLLAWIARKEAAMAGAGVH